MFFENTVFSTAGVGAGRLKHDEMDFFNWGEKTAKNRNLFLEGCEQNCVLLDQSEGIRYSATKCHSKCSRVSIWNRCYNLSIRGLLSFAASQTVLHEYVAIALCCRTLMSFAEKIHRSSPMFSLIDHLRPWWSSVTLTHTTLDVNNCLGCRSTEFWGRFDCSMSGRLWLIRYVHERSLALFWCWALLFISKTFSR